MQLQLDKTPVRDIIVPVKGRVIPMVQALNKRACRALVMAAAILCAFPAAAHSNAALEPVRMVNAPIPVEASTWNPFHSDRFRYQNMWLYPRVLTSIISFPMSVFDWNGCDWLTAGGVIASTAAFMVPLDGLSADARINYWVRGTREKKLRYLFPHVNTMAWSGFVAGWGLVFYGSGLIFKNSGILEYISLTLEAIAVTQFYHVSSKLLIGREGPPQGRGRGIIRGPAGALEYFPYGTPSGHIATLFAMTTVAAEYFDSWVIRILSYVLGAYYAVNLIYNEQHFVSDIIWGASLGYFVGHWIVRHRSSRYGYVRGNRVAGITIVNAGSGGSRGELVAYPFFDARRRSVNLCLSYLY